MEPSDRIHPHIPYTSGAQLRPRMHPHEVATTQYSDLEPVGADFLLPLEDVDGQLCRDLLESFFRNSTA